MGAVPGDIEPVRWILATLAFSYADLESETLTTSEGIRISVATPRMLYRMKRSTVRPQDRLDAEVIKAELKLSGD